MSPGLAFLNLLFVLIDMYGFLVDPNMSLILPIGFCCLFTSVEPRRGVCLEGTISLFVLVIWLIIPIFFSF
ncbi:hypothetical protein NL43_01195 [Methanosphaera sp. WGK6]|nr:hypothetical protein NL43_01195 [Methanosphaera sp. WGK6]